MSKPKRLGRRVKQTGALGIVGLLIALGVWLAQFLPNLAGPGDGPGTGVEAGKDADTDPPSDPVEPAPKPPECEFRIENNQVYHGTEPLTLDQFLAQARDCAEKGKVVDIEFVPDSNTWEFRQNVLEELENAAVPRRVRE